MFDWNDEELANIIWGEAGKTDDHIVPYSEGSEEKPQVLFGDYDNKEWKHETAAVKTESQAQGAKSDLYSHFDINSLSASKYGVGSWPNSSLSDATKPLYEPRADTTHNDNASEAFLDQVEEKEGSDFLDYGWAHVGSFDDLDRIVGHDDPMFGQVSLGNADDFWSFTKDVTNSPVKSFPLSVGSPTLGPGSLKNGLEQFEIKTESVLQNEPFASGCGNIREDTSCDQLISESQECRGGKSEALVGEQVTAASQVIHTPSNSASPTDFEKKENRQKKPPKYEKKSEVLHGEQLLQGFCNSWSPSGNQGQQLENNFVTSTIQSCPPSVLNQQWRFEESNSLQCQRMSNPCLAPGSTMQELPCFKAEPNMQLPMPSSYEVSTCHLNPLKELPDTSLKPLSMTPKEKIEKLRRRQQMQAMLAIKRQQEQLNQEISSHGHSIDQKHSQEIQIMHSEGTITEVEESLNAHPFPESYSPAEPDDSNMTSLALGDYSAEETVLQRLQEIIARLDIRIRLCLRDSLFRLAQSAVQRHYASDTSSTNRTSVDEQKAVTQEEINSHTRYSRILEVETQTNPIDRAVAHLLFHRPLDVSGKHPETLEVPSSKLPQ